MLLTFVFFIYHFCYLLLTLIWYSAFSKRGYIIHRNRRSHAVYIKISTFFWHFINTSHFTRYSKDTKKDQWKGNIEVKFWIERIFWLHPRYSLQIPLDNTLHTKITEQTNLQWKHWRKVAFVRVLLDYFSEN